MGPHYDHQVGRFEPPDPLQERDILLARARRARAEALADMYGAIYRGITTSARPQRGSCATPVPVPR